jgi:peptidoglycan/LPS O-acetylase OafA/YrhL
VSGALPHALERSSNWMLRSGIILLLVCGLMALAKRLVTKGSPWLSRLTDLVCSFYMFHFLVIYIIANLMLKLTDNLYLIFAMILLAGFAILVAIHEKVIMGSPLLTLLFNGKTARRAQPA